MARSRRQFGGVRRLPSGRWQVRYWTTGGRRAAAPHTFATKGEASRWLAAVEADQSRGVWVDPLAGKVTLAEYAWAWLQGKVNLAPRTREIYELQIRLHILPSIDGKIPALGPIALGNLRPELIRAWYAAVAKKRSKSVAAKAYSRLRQIMAQAVDDDRIAKNPCRIDGAAAERHPEQAFASLEELYELAEAVPDRHRALILTAGLAGLRQGELFGLRRRDVDLLHARITVRRKRLRLSSGVIVEDGPKSEAGRRTVALPSPLIPELERHLRLYGTSGPDEYVFCSLLGKPLERSNVRWRVWLPAVKAVGLEGLRFHDYADLRVMPTWSASAWSAGVEVLMLSA